MLKPARLELVTYFDSIISQIDLSAEILLASDQFEQSEDDRINERRNFLLKEIKSVEAFNLKHLRDDENQKEHIFKKFCFIFSESDFNKDNIDMTSLNVSKFGYLIITDSYLSPENLTCFKEMLKWSYKPQKLELNNLFFVFKNTKPEEKKAEPLLTVIREKIFATDFVVETTHDVIFKIDEMYLKDAIVESINSEASFLFRNVKKLRIEYSRKVSSLDDIIHTIQQFRNLSHSRLEEIGIKVFSSDKNVLKDLQALSNLTELVFHSSNMNSIDVYLFSRFQNLRVLNLVGNSIHNIEDFAFQELSCMQELNLELNQISSVGQFTFYGLVNLKKLSISYNRIILIHVNCLLFMHELEILDLSKNRATIHPGLIGNLIHLKELILNDNEFVQSGLSFRAFKSLTRLGLSNCRLCCIEPHFFGELETLESLDLSRNLLSNIDESVFADLINLVELRLDYNKIEQVRPNLFANLTKLEDLNLSHNRVSSLARDTFKGLQSLKKLNLSANKISFIQGRPFVELEKLQNLFIVNNGVTWFETDSFIDLGCLEILDLSFNRLQNVDPLKFDQLINLPCLKTLYLCNNEISQENKAELLRRLNFIHSIVFSDFFIYAPVI